MVESSDRWIAILSDSKRWHSLGIGDSPSLAMASLLDMNDDDEQTQAELIRCLLCPTFPSRLPGGLTLETFPIEDNASLPSTLCRILRNQVYGTEYLFRSPVPLFEDRQVYQLILSSDYPHGVGFACGTSAAGLGVHTASDLTEEQLCRIALAVLAELK